MVTLDTKGLITYGTMSCIAVKIMPMSSKVNFKQHVQAPKNTNIKSTKKNNNDCYNFNA